jgi:hypothetical protein
MYDTTVSPIVDPDHAGPGQGITLAAAVALLLFAAALGGIFYPSPAGAPVEVPPITASP